MALTKPILGNIGSFDAHVGFTFTFNVVGGDRVTGCRLSIFDNETDELVYYGEQTHDSHDFTLPEDATWDIYTITNKTDGFGGNYNVYIETTDGDGHYSAPSNRMQFYCFVTPTFQFAIDTPSIIYNATNTWSLIYDINPEYPTEDIDGLSTYAFILYNSDGSQAQTSQTLFYESRPDLSYTFSGLLSNSLYKIQAVATTHANSFVQISTILDEFQVQYDLPSLEGVVISATNVCEEGSIIIQLDIHTIPNLNTYQYVRLYRRDANNPNEDWLLLIENYVTMLSTGIYVYNDKYNRHGVTYEYALALTLFNGVEYSYTTTKVLSEFDGIFLLDLFTTYKIYAKPQYGGTTSVQKVGIHEPIGSKYPILVSNAITDYQKGSVTASVLDKDYESTREINRFSITQQMGILDVFLKNKQAKILKDWNGNIWLCSIVGEPNIAYDNNYGMGYIDCSFEWVEQGKYNKYDDLLKNGLLSNLSPVSIKFTGLEGTVIDLNNSNRDNLTATIDADGEITITTYTMGNFTGTATLTNSFGTQVTNISANIISGVLNVINVPHYNLTINGESGVYSAKSLVHLTNGNSVINALLPTPTVGNPTPNLVIPIIQTGIWTGYVLAYTNQKQPINITMGELAQTYSINPACTLNIISPNDVSYSLSNANGGFVNTINGIGNKIFKLFTSGVWSGTIYASGNQTREITVADIIYGDTLSHTIPYTQITFSATARLDESVSFGLGKDGNKIAKLFATPNGSWVQSTTKNKDECLVYGGGYWVSYSKAKSSMKYSNGNPPMVWTTQTLNTDVIWKKVVYGNGYWVGLDTMNRLWYKKQYPITTWTHIDLSSWKSGLVLTDISYGNGYWVASTGHTTYSGSKGIWYNDLTPTGTWTFKSLAVASATILGNVSYVNGYWICMDAYDSSHTNGGFWYVPSVPSGTWLYKQVVISGGLTSRPKSISYGNGYWVIFDDNSNGIYYTDGDLSSTWVGYNYLFGGYVVFFDMIYANGYWILSYQNDGDVTDAGIFYRYGDPLSYPDMSNWIKQPISGAGLSHASIDILYGNGYLVITGSSYTRSHKFPTTQPSPQTETYSLIVSGGWTGLATIDDYIEYLSTVVPDVPSGSVTFSIQDKGLT